ncbi:hypothetical protein Tco_1067180 [Tanacetum coccineum]|uniref:Pentatricopeptide repeat-containing protein n=1 Tax=Tanacetum coccineum TaxID=301880 RepID=A0ABQ5HEA6_9ASTR
MDDNSNGDLHSSGEMDSGDETIGDVCLDNSMDTDMNDNGTSDKENEKALLVKGISTLSSRLGKPLIMDYMIATMCYNGTGRAAYARVLAKLILSDVEVVKTSQEALQSLGRVPNRCGILRRLKAFVASPIGCGGSDVGIA